MRIISQAAINEFAAKDAQSREPLMHWYRVTKQAAWQNLAEVRSDFPQADPVEGFTVFNIAGNRNRLIALIKYRWQVVYIRHILTHNEYAKEKWKS